jgi:hypothetical protein
MEKLKDHWVLSFVGLVSALVGMYPVINNLAPDEVDRPAAREYLHNYYDTATRDPSKAFDEFHQPTETRSEFVAHFGKISLVRIKHIRSTPEGDFTATVTYCHEVGEDKIRMQRFTLVCSRWSEVPFVHCGDIRMHDNVTNGGITSGFFC